MLPIVASRDEGVPDLRQRVISTVATVPEKTAPRQFYVLPAPFVKEAGIVAALLNATGGVTTTPAVLLGDRIKVTGVKLDGHAIVVDLLNRGAGQPLSESPSVASTKRFVVDRGALIAR